MTSTDKVLPVFTPEMVYDECGCVYRITTPDWQRIKACEAHG